MTKTKPSILVVDDELSIRESFKLILEGPYDVHLAATGESGLKKLVDEKIDLVFLDVRMPGISGLEALSRFKEIDPSVDIIMVTAVNEVQKATSAINSGAHDYVIKPFDVVQILKIVETALKKKSLAKETQALRQESEGLPDAAALIGNTEIINKIRNDIEKFASFAEPLAIQGPLGTEKEILARQICKKSRQFNRAFVALDLPRNEPLAKIKDLFCGRSETSSAAILEKNIGWIEKAAEGCLFINNIENLSHEAQSWLANLWQLGEFSRQDYAHPIKITCRLIAASNYNLQQLHDEGKIEPALLNLFNERTITLPPLRDRATDLPQLVSALIEEAKKKYNKKITGVSNKALDVMTNYSYPGNVLELRDLVDLLVLNATGELLEVESLPLEILIGATALTGEKERPDLAYDEMQKNFESSLLSHVYTKTNRSLKKTSYLLGMSPRVLVAKMEQFEIK